MRFRASLRIRFVAAVFALAVLICGGFYFAVYQFVEVLEHQLMETVVQRKLHQPPDAVRHGGPSGADTDGMRSWVLDVHSSPPPDFPQPLLAWPSGTLGEIKIDGIEHYAGRRDVNGVSVFAVLDIGEIEELERRLVNIAYIVILAALIAAILVGHRLSRLVMKPVTRLSEYVASLDPAGERLHLRERFDDQEVGLIAEAIDRYQDRIEQFVRRERDFTDDASHELRTPLAVIHSALPLLNEDDTLSVPSRERLQRIDRAARRMQMMIETLLFLAREDGGGHSEPCPLGDIVEELVNAWRPAAAEKGLQLRCEIDARPVVPTPSGMASCVIGNLISNAVQHTDSGHVLVRVQADRIIVEDSGPGIAASDGKRIFERRYRGTRSGGFGLGLYLVQRLCERLGWVIELASPRGHKGTRFEIIVLPPALTKR